jgi:hypothetical protein
MGRSPVQSVLLSSQQVYDAFRGLQSRIRHQSLELADLAGILEELRYWNFYGIGQDSCNLACPAGIFGMDYYRCFWTNQTNLLSHILASQVSLKIMVQVNQVKCPVPQRLHGRLSVSTDGQIVLRVQSSQHFSAIVAILYD